MTVREVIERIKAESGAFIPDEQTCDILTAGDPEMEVTKIGSTFMATVDVIKEAAAQGINFIITHEPTWFNGLDKTEWLQDDIIYLEKKRLLEEHHIAVWRYHDHMHMGNEDQIYAGFEDEFGWKQYRIPVTDTKRYGETDPGAEQFWSWYGGIYQLPGTSLRDLADFFKKHARMDVIQIVGNPDHIFECRGTVYLSMTVKPKAELLFISSMSRTKKDSFGRSIFITNHMRWKGVYRYEIS